MPTTPADHALDPAPARAAVTSASCCSTESRSWTRSGPGRCSRTGPSTTPRTAGTSPACRPEARTSWAPRTSSWAPITRWTTRPPWTSSSIRAVTGTRRLLRDPAHLDWVRAQRAAVPLMTSVCTGSLVYAAAGMLTRSARHHALGVAEPALRDRSHRHHRRRRPVRRRRGPDHQRRRERRHRHGPAPRGPTRRHRTRPRRPPRHPVRPATARLRHPTSGSRLHPEE